MPDPTNIARRGVLRRLLGQGERAAPTLEREPIPQPVSQAPTGNLPAVAPEGPPPVPASSAPAGALRAIAETPLDRRTVLRGMGQAAMTPVRASNTAAMVERLATGDPDEIRRLHGAIDSYMRDMSDVYNVAINNDLVNEVRPNAAATARMISRLNPRFNADEVASAVREALDNGAVPWDPGAIIGDGALTSSSMVREIARRAGLTPAVVRRHVGNDPLQTVFQPFLYGHDDMIDNAIGMADRARANGVTLNGTEDYIRHSLPEGSAINPAEINASWQNNARYHTELPEDDVFREILNPQAGSQTYWDAHPSPSVTPGPVDQPNSRLPRAPVYNDPNQVGIRISGHADDKYHGIDPLSAYAHELELNRLHNVSPSLIGQPREVIGSFIEPGATRRDTFAVRPMVETQRWHQDEFLKEYLMENGLLTGQGRPNNPLRRMSEGEQ